MIRRILAILFTRYTFFYALGCGFFTYLMFHFLGLILYRVADIVRTFATWYQYHGVRAAEELGVVVFVMYILIAAVMSSRSHHI